MKFTSILKSALWGNILALLLGCVFVVALLLTVEGLLHVKVWMNTRPGEGAIHSNLNEIIVPYPRLGYRAKPSAALKETLTRGGAEIYSCTYHIDQNGNRITPFADSDERNFTALFLGCSFTFGTGVNDDETLPAQFAANAPTYHPVNAGLNSYGLQQVWLQLTDPGFLDKLPFDKGIAVYTFIDHHVDRLVGTPAVLNAWEYPLPWLIEKNRHVEYNGTFAARDPFQFFINRYCRRSHLFRFVENRLRTPAITETISSEMLDFTAFVLMDAARKLHELRPGIQLYMLFFPDCIRADEIKKRLDENLVKSLDYSDLFGAAALPKDRLWYKDSGAAEFGHPKAETYTIVANQLAKDIPACQ